MPRRSSTRFQPQIPSSPPPSLTPAHTATDSTSNLLQLRTNWKWAAFSQFFFTFNHILAMNDLSLNDIEGDLTIGSCIVLPRIMQRLLYTLSYDRKISLDNWQTALRKQYRKRDPAANPIGPEPRAPTPEPQETELEDTNAENATEEEAVSHADGRGSMSRGDAPMTTEDSDNIDTGDKHDPKLEPESTRASTLERGLSIVDSLDKGLSVQPSELGELGRGTTVDGTEDNEGARGRQDMEETEYEEQEESKDWLELPMLAKLDSMHLLMEWQFQNPMRLRTLMRTDDDGASWRIEPIGYDSKKNAYWLIGADRLWLQRPIPRPPKPKTTPASLKRKRGSNANGNTKGGKSGAAKGKNAKRPRLVAQNESPSPHHPTTRRGKTPIAKGRGSRAAKNEANLKLDMQAKELAALNRQASALAKEEAVLKRGRRAGNSIGLRTSKRGVGNSPNKPMGTRVSRRLRGAADDEGEWQAVPDEWLNDAGEAKMNGKGNKLRGGRKGKGKEVDGDDDEEGKEVSGNARLKTGLESDGSEISDLTELSESSEERKGEPSSCITEELDEEEAEQDEPEPVEPLKQEESRAVVLPAPRVDDRGLEDQPVLPEGFIEWETICVTLEEWDHVAQPFAKATHYTEKALYKVLVNHIIPAVTEELREIDRKNKLSLALTQRKRSSRLLLRQSEKEEAEAAARKVAEEEEKNGRAKRLEARLKKEEADRERRETSREMRRREREEKEEREREAKTAKANKGVNKAGSFEAEDSDMQVDVGDIKLQPAPGRQQMALRYNGNGTGMGSGSRTPVGDDWELDCEICHRRGINVDDGTPMMSCGLCSKWQHIACHDRADQQMGRRRRNWDVVEFFCLQCRTDRARVHNAGGDGRQTTQPGTGITHVQRQSQNPYMAYTTAGVIPYKTETSTGHAGYVTQPMNGSGPSHIREQQTPHARSGHTSPSQLRHAQQHPQQQPYNPPISFTHYQPQHRGFSSSTPGGASHYNTSAYTQQYGQHHPGTSQPYPQYPSSVMTNGGGQPYQPISQTQWNVTTPAHAHGYNAIDPMHNPGPDTSTVRMQYGHGHHPVTTPTQWQQHPQTATIPPNIQEPATQFRYHPPYHPPPP